MKTVFVVYKTDCWHSYASRDLIGIALTQNDAITICKKQAKKEGEKLDKYQIFNLLNIKQTQGFTGDGEFVIEELQTIILL